MEAAIAVSLGVDFFSTIEKQTLNDQAADFRDQQIRSQQVQARLQDAQQDIAEQQKLRQTIATTMVQSGTRGISSSSASLRAIFEHDYSQYDQDKDARRLNLSEKELGLNFEQQNSDLVHDSYSMNNFMGFAKDVANLGMLSQEGDLPTGKMAPVEDAVPGNSGALIPDTNR